MAEKKQYNVRIEEQLISRLSRLAAKLGYSSGNEFAAEALDQYAELIADLLKEQRDQMVLIKKRQREQLLGCAQSPEPSGRK